MKKLLSSALAMIIGATLLVGCGSKSGGSELKSGTELLDVAYEVSDTLMMPMPQEADAEMAKILFYITDDIAEEYAILNAMVNVSSANVAIVKAKDGKVEDVKAALTKRKADVITSFEQYLPDQLEFAKAGKVLVNGNYVSLIIGEEADEAEKTLNSYFE